MKNQKTYQKSWVMLCIVLVVLTAICTAFIYQSISKESNSNNDSSNLSNVTESMGNNFVKEKTESPSNFLNSNNENKSISEASIIKKSESAVNFPVKSNIDNNEYVNNKNDNTPVNDDNEAQDIEDDEENNNLCDSNWCDDYPDWLKNAPMNSIQNDGWGYPNRQCTSFAAWRLNRNGIPFRANYLGGLFGHANTWGGVARRVGINVDSNPAVGSIAWTARGDYGHVAYVAAVNGDNVTIEDYNTNRGAYGIWTVNRWSYEYIHFGGEGGGGGGTPVSVDEGMYILKSAVGDRNLDVSGNSYDCGANMYIYHMYNFAKAQEFHIYWNPYAGDHGQGGYHIEHGHSGLFVDTENNSSQSGANIIQWADTGANGQYWTFEDAGDGYVYIRSLNGLCLDVDYGVDADCRNVQSYHWDGTQAQKWKLIRISGNDSVNVDPSTSYNIRAAVGDRNLDVECDGETDGVNIKIYHMFETRGQLYNIYWNSQAGNFGQGGYHIEHAHLGKFVDTAADCRDSGGNVWQWGDSGANGQYWLFEDAGNGYVYIRNLWGYYLDVDGGIDEDNRNVRTWTFNGSNAQKWKLIPRSGNNEIFPPDKEYVIHSALDKDIFQVHNDESQPGANVELGEATYTHAQKFNTVWDIQAGNFNQGGFHIEHNHIGQYLDVANNSQDHGSNVWQSWSASQVNGQYWRFEDAGDGYVYIHNLWGSYLDVTYSSTIADKNVQIWYYNGTPAQKFKLVPWEEEGKIEIPKANQVSYNGKEQEGVSKKPGYYLKNNTAIKPGTYKATAYLEHPEKVTWEDNTIDPKEIIYTIDKAILNASYVSERVDVLKFKPKLEIKVEGFVNGENPETAEGYKAPHLNRTQFDDIGEYTLVPEGGAALNYNFTYTPGLLELFNSSYTAVAIRDDNTKTIEFQFNNFDGFDKKEMLFDWESDTWRSKRAGYKYIINKNFRHYKVINCKSLFAGGSSIENLKYLNTEKTTDMTEMFGFFGDKNKPTQNLDFSNFNTSNVVNMTRMFWFSNIENLDLSSVKAPKLKDAQSMFAECYKLESVDISNLIVDSKPCISWMFENSEKLKTIYVNPGTKWQNGINVTKSIGAFLNCKSLVGEKGTRWEPWDKGITRACVDGLNNQQGYFTAKH